MRAEDWRCVSCGGLAAHNTDLGRVCYECLPKPFICRECGKAFPSELGRNGHMNSHTRKPFAPSLKCARCEDGAVIQRLLAETVGAEAERDRLLTENNWLREQLGFQRREVEITSGNTDGGFDPNIVNNAQPPAERDGEP